MIITNLMGGLGNQMFQYAAGLALAKRNATTLKMDLFTLRDRSFRFKRFTFRDFELGIFNISATAATESEVGQFVLPRTMNRLLYHMLQLLTPKHNYYCDVAVEQFRKIPADSYIDGYWQDKGYYGDVEQELRQEFTFRNRLPDSSTPIVVMMQGCDNPVSLHVRRGDYVGHPDLDAVVGRDYYLKAVDTLRSIVSGKLTIFIFSDDLKWCREELDFGDEEVVFVGSDFTGGKGECDLHLMTLCRHFVIANSSFSFWGAWLAPAEGKRVVAPKQWKLNQPYEKKPTLPEDWIVV